MLRWHMPWTITHTQARTCALCCGKKCRRCEEQRHTRSCTVQCFTSRVHAVAQNRDIDHRSQVTRRDAVGEIIGAVVGHAIQTPTQVQNWTSFFGLYLDICRANTEPDANLNH
eukprot:1269071-Amphidinium_carterae.1